VERSFEQAGSIGQEFVESGLRCAAAFSNGMQLIASEAADYSKASFESGSKAFEQVMKAKSPDKALQIQAEYARRAYEDMVAQSTRMSQLCADLARDVYKPFEAIVAKPK
jgi:hypothetical protein